MLVYYAAPDGKEAGAQAKTPRVKEGTIGQKGFDGAVKQKGFDGTAKQKAPKPKSERAPSPSSTPAQTPNEGEEGLEPELEDDGINWGTIGDKEFKKPEEKKERDRIDLGASDMIDVILEWGYKALDKKLVKASDWAADKVENFGKKVIKEIDMIATPHGKKTWEMRMDKWSKWKKSVKEGNLSSSDKKALNAGIKSFESTKVFENQVTQAVGDLSKEGVKSQESKQAEENLVTRAKSVDNDLKNADKKKQKNKTREQNLDRSRAGGNNAQNQAVSRAINNRRQGNTN
jgi:hypothetical protein